MIQLSSFACALVVRLVKPKLCDLCISVIIQ